MNNLDYLKKYKLFIVDYDGTIIDSMPMWNRLLSSFLRDNNISFDEDIDEIAKEQTNVESVKYVHEHYLNNLSYDELENMMFEYVKKQYVLQKLKPGAKELLEAFKRNGRVVLFSATANELLDESFKTNGINKYLDYIYSASNMGITKSGGTGFNKIIEIEGFDKKDVLVIEDVYHAIVGAKSQGIDTLAIYDNQKSWNEIIKISNYNLLLDEINPSA